MTDQPTASIDDLLHEDGDENRAGAAPVPQRRSPWVWLIRTGVVAAVLTAAVVFGLLLLGVRIPAVPVFAGLVALFLLRRELAQVAAPPSPRLPARSARAYRQPGAEDGPDALQLAVQRWAARLDLAGSDPARFSRTVLPVLAELADERLRLRHGLTCASDPERARDMLGEPLWRLLNEPGRAPRRRELAAHVQTLEGL